MNTLRSERISKRTYKVILLGDSGVGKTSLVQKYVHGTFSSNFNVHLCVAQPTVGIDFVKKDILIRGASCSLHFWDTAGQQKFKSLTPKYLRDAICAIFVFDVNKPHSLVNLQGWITLFRENKKEKAIAVICGNKNDLQKKIDKELLSGLIEKYRMPYFTVSTKEGSNLGEMFQKLVELIDKEEEKKIKQIKEKYMEDDEYAAPTRESFVTHQGELLETMREGKSQQVKLVKGGVKKCCCY